MRIIKNSAFPRRLQKGFMLLETALALLIVSAVGTIALNAQLADLKDQKAIAQAHSLLQVQAGANSYITNFRSQLASGTPIPGVTSIYDPTIAELDTLNVGLPPNFSNAALIGGTYRVHVQTTPSPCTPTSCQISAITWVTQPLNENDGSVDYPRLGLAMRALGADGAISSNIDSATGAVNPASAGSIRGANNAWNMANPAGAVPGILAARAGFDAQIFNQFVRRDGQSQMTGHLQLGDGVNNNDIINLRNLTADGAVTANSINATGSIAAGSTMIAAGSITAGGNVSAGANVSANGFVQGNRIQSSAGATGAASNGYYDLSAGKIAANTSIYSYGKICSGNSSGDCSGSGGTVMDGGNLTTSNLNASNIATSNLYNAGNAITAGSQTNYGTITNGAATIVQSNDWSILGYDANGGANANAQSGTGSAYLNDSYFRSAGQWASQISKTASDALALANANANANAGANNAGNAFGNFCFSDRSCGVSVGTTRAVTCFQYIPPSPGTDAYSDAVTNKSIRWNGAYWDDGQFPMANIGTAIYYGVGYSCSAGFIFH